MKKIVLLLAPLLIAGCAVATKTYAPDGSEAYAINCSGGGLTWGECYAKAGDKCGASGYEVLSKDGDQQSSVSGTQFGLFGAQSMNRSLVVKCKT